MNENAAAASKKEYRVLFASDTHYLSGENLPNIHHWGGRISCDDRAQQWVDAVLEEHRRQPFDMMLFLGDYSLDWWGDQGTWQKEGFSDAVKFFEKYMSRLPGDLPVYIMAGNHECYTDAQWKALSGYSRQGVITLGDNVFIMLDAFNSPALGDVTTEVGYTGPDLAYAKEQIEKYPGYNVYLCGHRLYEDAFAELIAANDRIRAVIYGDTHRTIAWQATFGSNTVAVAETGQFSYPGINEVLHGWNWGFRELCITQTGAVSNYIIARHRYEENGEIKWAERKLTNPIRIYDIMISVR